MFLIIILIILFIIFIVYLSKNDSHNHGGSYPSAYDDDDEDEFIHDEMSDETGHSDHYASSFAYPDPSEMEPADRMYLGEDGELLEDL